MRLPPLNGLRALEAVLRHHSLTAAADELAVTPAAVSQRIRALEDYFGRSLFRRTPHGLEPLAEVEEVRGRLTRAFADLSDLAAEFETGEGRTLTITITNFFADHWLTPRLTEFRKFAPGVTLEIEAGNRLVDLAAEPIDGALRFCDRPPDGCDGRLLFGEVALPVCTPAFAETHGLGEGRMDLTGVPLFHTGGVTSDPEWPDWTTWLARFGIARGDRAEDTSVSKVHAGLQAALAGAGLAICGMVDAHVALRSRHLVAPFGFERNIPTSWAYHILWRANRSPSPAMRAFRRWIEEAASSYRREVLNLSGIELAHPETRSSGLVAAPL